MRPFFAKALTLLVGASICISPAFAARFIDTSGSWTEKYINVLSDRGVIAAERDGKFNPDKPVTRAVLAVWLVKVLGLDNQPVPEQSSFPDVKPGDWCFRAIEIIRQNNYISGYADGFRPNQFIQKAEVLSILARTLNAPQPDENQVSQELSKYTDGDKVPTWARTGVAQASLAGLLVSPDGQTISPTAMATRGETAAYLAKLDEINVRKEIASAANRPAQPAQPAPQNYSQPADAGQQQPAYDWNRGGPPQGGYNQQQYQGQVTKDYKYNQPPPSYAQPQGGPPPQQAYQGGYAGQGQYAPQNYGGPPQNVLQGQVAVVAAGTRFHANLQTNLDSGSAQPGDQVTATLSEPIISNGAEVVPAGSRLIGNVTNVVKAAHFKAGANGKIDIRFNSVETPDGRRFPISASVDTSGGGTKMSGGTAAGRVGKGVVSTAVGAGGGALLGTAIGAIVGSASGNMGRGLTTGVLLGTTIGAGGGAVHGVVRKGSEVRIGAGTNIALHLDQSMQVTGAPPPPQYGGYGGGGGYQPPPPQSGYNQGGGYQGGYQGAQGGGYQPPQGGYNGAYNPGPSYGGGGYQAYPPQQPGYYPPQQ